ncbi:uncharacterized protein LOC142538985 isoform X2 [Primulina tabacum]|uniref:uncharacterized protein LOC142538985 isoform X2 n=1 Tax=Primulina tabacum TaxID=48773 RepID=UPI003F59F498
MDDGSILKSRSLSGPRSESKVSVEQKRGVLEVEEKSGNSPKRIKMRDIESVFRSEGGEANNVAHLNVNIASRELDLNVNIDPIDDANGNEARAMELNKSFSPKIQAMECRDGFAKARGLDLDLNVEDISSSINHPYHSYKNPENLKSVDDSDCGSSIGPLDEKDSMKLWKEIKQNGYMSAPYGAVPMLIPKSRGRKGKNEMLKKKIELAKKEQIDRFARVAAPSGLLHGLNPGIINHVRNKKQVHSIIEAIVKSERNENLFSGSDQCSQMKSGIKEHAERKNMENVSSSGPKGHEAHREDTFFGSMQMKGYPFFSGPMSLNSEVTRDGDSYMGARMTSAKMHSKFKAENDDDALIFRPLSSETVASENNSSLTHDSANLSSVTSLSVKAANVASQWLELLNQDIKGRLAALRRSKKRVCAVIQIDLPFLMSKESSSDQETTKGHGENAEAHRIRWSSLFGEMDKALSEEERHLESWLNQVKEMQLNCDKGFYKTISYYAPQHSSLTRNESRSAEVDNSEKDLAVRAAAASIYSTCNFLLSMKNQPCC